MNWGEEAIEYGPRPCLLTPNRGARFEETRGKTGHSPYTLFARVQRAQVSSSGTGESASKFSGPAADLHNMRESGSGEEDLSTPFDVVAKFHFSRGRGVSRGSLGSLGGMR